MLILIGGGTGTGKTSLALNIVRDVGSDKVLLMHMDNYYKDFSGLKPEDRENINFDHPKSIDWNLLDKQLTMLLNNESIKMPVYDFKTHTRQRYKTVQPKEIIILEGILALWNKDINKKAGIKLFVETPDDIRFIRRLQRDLNERGRSIESVIKQWLTTVRPMHQEFVKPSRGNADVIIPEDPQGGMREVARDMIKALIRESKS